MTQKVHKEQISQPMKIVPKCSNKTAITGLKKEWICVTAKLTPEKIEAEIVVQLSTTNPPTKYNK